LIDILFFIALLFAGFLPVTRAVPVKPCAFQPDTGYVLYPPQNLELEFVECNVYGSWDMPQLPGGGMPPGLIGYNVIRNNLFFAFVSGPDTTWFYDCDLEWGWAVYTIRAKYDLTPYGYPGQFGESEGITDSIFQSCYQMFPFYEPWDQGSFIFRDWSFIPGPGNWQITVNAGNPAPTAIFTGTPYDINYSYRLISDVLLPIMWPCADMYLEFDYRLYDESGSGTEKLIVELLYDSIYHQVREYANAGSTGWIHDTIHINQALQDIFMIVFHATGQFSGNIIGWHVDNIYCYMVCRPITSCGINYPGSGNAVELYWSPPVCPNGNNPPANSFDGYSVYRSDSLGMPPFQQISEFPYYDTVFTDVIPQSMVPGLYRYYILASYNDTITNEYLCDGLPGDTLSALVTGMTDIQASTVRVYPNPMKDRLTVSSSHLIKSIEILDVLGISVRRISGINGFRAEPDLRDLKPGIYFGKIETASGVSTIRFIRE
jgi:hypothetical protein